MDWALLRRGLLRYSLVAAGGTVAVLVGVAGTAAAVVTFAAGLTTLLWAVSGGGNVRTTTAASNADSMGVAGTVSDAADNAPESLPSDVRVFFYGIGLLVWSPVAVAVAVFVV
ncbi:hypothetical protein [Halobaculum magnesiiphilum]|uniref:DUF8070 domain-containing protein n=1 Tax=Halobaculum magnesiiphilum TaxID=1017351 RepID=A0A8T8WB30_9EURY|nr:hypothetical protein [Halobaculum magnesiiphilum]QZP37040.1 hypothetical protein K6T50_12165 [Halobaculum magnesiiphilum]